MRPTILNRRRPSQGTFLSEQRFEIPWKYLPRARGASSDRLWIHLVDETEGQNASPEQMQPLCGGDAILTVVPRGTGSNAWEDTPPYYVRRSPPLLGRSVDTCRLQDLHEAIAWARAMMGEKRLRIGVCGRANAGVLALYTALLNPEVDRVLMIDPPASHHSGPVLPNILRTTDIPEAMALFSPSRLEVHTSNPPAFAATERLYLLGGGEIRLQPMH